MQKTIKNMTYWILFIGLSIACKDEAEKLLPPPQNPLEGKVKAIAFKTETGNKITTEWVYDQTTKQITGAKKVDSVNKTTLNEVYKRDTDGKILSISIEKVKDGTTTKTEKTYQYNDKNQVTNITESINPSEQIVEDLIYDADAKLTRYTISNKKANQASVLRLIQYTWKAGNVSGIKDRNLQSGYEEEDFQYNSNENVVAKLYREEFKVSGFTPEFISQNTPVSSVKLFDGSRFKYEYEYSKTNQLIGYKILKNNGNNWEVFNDVKVIYHE